MWSCHFWPQHFKGVEEGGSGLLTSQHSHESSNSIWYIQGNKISKHNTQCTLVLMQMDGVWALAHTCTYRHSILRIEALNRKHHILNPFLKLHGNIVCVSIVKTNHPSKITSLTASKKMLHNFKRHQWLIQQPTLYSSTQNLSTIKFKYDVLYSPSSIF